MHVRPVISKQVAVVRQHESIQHTLWHGCPHNRHSCPSPFSDPSLLDSSKDFSKDFSAWSRALCQHSHTAVSISLSLGSGGTSGETTVVACISGLHPLSVQIPSCFVWELFSLHFCASAFVRACNSEIGFGTLIVSAEDEVALCRQTLPGK